MASMKTNLIPAVSILLNRAEGPVRECGEKLITPEQDKDGDVWAAAHAQLRRWSYSAPKGGGYDKTDFTVTWADGHQYEGRFDLSYDWDQDAASLEQHIHNHCTFYAGLRCPSHMGEIEYRQHLNLPYIAEMKAELVDLLRRYDIHGMPGLTPRGDDAQCPA